MRIKQLKEKEAILPQQLDATKRQLQLQIQALEKLTIEVSEVEKARKYKLDELAKGSAFYSERLGLRFERFEDKGVFSWSANWSYVILHWLVLAENHLRFTLVKIDKRDPRREFYFDIYVQENLYEGNLAHRSTHACVSRIY